MLQKTSSLTQLNRTLSAFLAGFKLQRRQAAEANWLTRFKAKQMQISVVGGEGAILLFLFPVRCVCVCVCGWANKSLGWPVTQSVSQSVRHAVSQKPKSATKLKSMHGQLHLAASSPLLPLPQLASSRPQQIQHRPEPTSPEQPRQAAATACSYLWHILQFCGFHLQN